MTVPNHVWRKARTLNRVDSVFREGLYWYAELASGEIVRLCKATDYRRNQRASKRALAI